MEHDGDDKDDTTLVMVDEPETTRKKSTNSRTVSYCVIVNIRTVPGKKERTGSEKDVKELRDIFTKEKYQVDVQEDLSRFDLEDLIADYSRGEKLMDAEKFIFFLMSHGNKNGVFGSDGNQLNVERDVLQRFNNRNCRSLRGVPKIFIFQVSALI